MTEVVQDTGAVGAARNTPARISVWAAFLGVSLIAAVFLTPMFWLLYGGTYTFLVFFSLLLVLAYAGLLAGLAFLADSAS